MENRWGRVDPEGEESERRHFHDVLSAFKSYKGHALKRVSKTDRFMSTLSHRHQEYLEKYKEALSQIKECIRQNDIVVNSIISDATAIFINVPSSKISLPEHNGDDFEMSDNEINNGQECKNISDKPKNEDIEKVQSVLKQFVRDWSSDGEIERNQCYTPIIDVIQKEFPDPRGITVLVPGAGLGRLAYEMAVRGYSCEGNEFSLFMLFASNFVLNKCRKVNGHKIYPWAHQYVNNLTCESQIREVKFPDVDPYEIVNAEFSMTAGDFLKVYVDPDKWDCVATCFFIDCAPNVIVFIETIFNVLKPGGIWVNLGPLLYHYSDMANEDSVEPPFDILCDIIEKTGFVMEFRKTGVKTRYAQNPRSMLQYEYDSVFFVCRKPNKIRNA
ncbi:carnosine N-methyltransferase unmet [Arctopsyche grandis]|uniref:carnosine N-methyltransferase unmet n=1 Tax=Arctopsyche grandis TaxID=121162 RepID=UPI00406D8587